jgi:uncharacterized protein (DUF1499 family)
MRPVTILIASLGAVVALLPLAVLLLGPARIWSVFGPADLGPVDFARLERRSSPNDALARPDALPGAARADIAAPVFAIDARALRAAMARALAEERDLLRVAVDPVAGTERYVQRTPLLGFPDTIDVLYLDLPEGRGTLALYSRSQLGYRDLGANRARIERWLARLTRVAPVAP